MPLYRVSFERTQTHDVQIEAESYEAAADIADEMASDLDDGFIDDDGTWEAYVQEGKPAAYMPVFVRDPSGVVVEKDDEPTESTGDL